MRGESGISKLIATCLLSLSAGAAIVYVCTTEPGPPPRSQLARASGRVEWFERSRHDLHFGLSGSPRRFSYPAWGGGWDAVHAALSREGANVEVGFDASDSSAPPWPWRHYIAVRELSADGRPVRTYEQIVAGRQRDLSVGVYLGFAFLAGGAICAAQAGRRILRRRRYGGGLPPPWLQR
ncbi:hypothetical protein J5226_12990 [Lysobacter sp. K5869]|uniref:hypothetical protein n=1 Tax=Lysobacter sp. K5869 TaxID=2820808 RepID=UPI001C05F0E4|nr:hypothetical protein [Lysobacter sp. K5869]QWP74614.1 hypothetical protein J5226_12990 [Lysobacter sp. K5869]